MQLIFRNMKLVRDKLGEVAKNQTKQCKEDTSKALAALMCTSSGAS